MCLVFEFYLELDACYLGFILFYLANSINPRLTYRIISDTLVNINKGDDMVKRIMVSFEPRLYEQIRKLSRKKSVSLSRQIRTLVEDALEISEDTAWVRKVEKRIKRSPHPKLTPAENVWGRHIR